MRQRTLTRDERELWEQGGLSFWTANYTDLLLSEAFNREAYDFWRESVRARIAEPTLADLLAPADPPHPFGVTRPSLEQTYYDVVNQDNVSLVALRAAPIERVTVGGVRTTDGEHRVDLLVLATGLDRGPDRGDRGGRAGLARPGRSDRLAQPVPAR